MRLPRAGLLRPPLLLQPGVCRARVSWRARPLQRSGREAEPSAASRVHSLLAAMLRALRAGTGEVLGTVDADLAAFLLGLTDEQLNSTAVLLVSDHGMTMGINYMLTQNGRVRNAMKAMQDRSSTQHGGGSQWRAAGAMAATATCRRAHTPALCSSRRAADLSPLPPLSLPALPPRLCCLQITEHKIPLLAMLLPAWVGERYPAQAAALAANEQRLVSGYDLHATLHHLLHLGESDVPPEQQYDSWRVAGNVAESVRWGVSLLAEVPAGRNCDEAGIPPDFCQCFAP